MTPRNCRSSGRAYRAHLVDEGTRCAAATAGTLSHRHRLQLREAERLRQLERIWHASAPSSPKASSPRRNRALQVTPWPHGWRATAPSATRSQHAERAVRWRGGAPPGRAGWWSGGTPVFEFWTTAISGQRLPETEHSARRRPDRRRLVIADAPAAALQGAQQPGARTYRLVLGRAAGGNLLPGMAMRVSINVRRSRGPATPSAAVGVADRPSAFHLAGGRPRAAVPGQVEGDQALIRGQACGAAADHRWRQRLHETNRSKRRSGTEPMDFARCISPARST